MELTLMCQDREVAVFELDLAAQRVTDVLPLAHAGQAPLSIRLEGPDPAEDLTRFLTRRALSPWRADLGHILSATHAANAIELALRAHGLSLSDPYWYRAADDGSAWQSLNFFDNDWDPTFGEAVVAQDWETLATASCMVPDVTCTGFAPKAWVPTATGPRLRKAALAERGADPAGEVLASRLAALILPEGASLPYELEQRDGRLFSSCPLMVAPDEELVSARALCAPGPRHGQAEGRTAVWDEPASAAYVAILDAVGVPHPWQLVCWLLTCATLAMQSDLHPGNCGIIHNVRTGAVRPAPLFDFGGCFGTSANRRGVEAAVAAPRLAERFLTARCRRLDPSWDYTWYDCHALDGFCQQLEQFLEQEAQLPPAYVSVVAELFEQQRAYVEGTARKRAKQARGKEREGSARPVPSGERKQRESG